jgi:4-hydroxy-tetrahydrodipicolinate synthase
MTIPLLCRTATTFSKSGALDEDALRLYLQRFIDAKLGVYLGSGGTGEGHTLSIDELRRVYQIGVETCKGKVPVYANPPEQYTARATREHNQLAVDCGVEVVNIYALAGLHSMRPTEMELAAYYNDVLSAIKHPVALAAQPLVGYSVKPEMIADLCRRYPQVVAVNLTGVSDLYFLQLKALISRDVAYYVPITASMHTLGFGATGLLATEANIIPKTYRRYLDLYEQKKFDELGYVYADIKRYLDYTSRWNPGPTRWVKMAMKAFKLPGGEGGVREPYRMPPDAEIQKFIEGLIQLGLPEIEEQARASGWPV